MPDRFSPFNPPIFNVQFLIESSDLKKSDDEDGGHVVVVNDHRSAAFVKHRQRYEVELLYEGQVVSSQAVFHGVGRNLFLSARTQQLRIVRTAADFVSGSAATIDLTELFSPTNEIKIHTFRLDAEVSILLAAFEIGKRDRRPDGCERFSQTEAKAFSDCGVQAGLAGKRAAGFKHKLSQTDETNSAADRHVNVQRNHVATQTTTADERPIHYENEEMILNSDVLRRVLFHVIFALLRRLKSKTPVPAVRRKSTETQKTAEARVVVVKQVATDISIPAVQQSDFIPTVRRQLRADSAKLEKTRMEMQRLFAMNGRRIIGAINGPKMKSVQAQPPLPAKVQDKNSANRKQLSFKTEKLWQERRVIAENADEKPLSLHADKLSHSVYQQNHFSDDKSLAKPLSNDVIPRPFSVGQTMKKPPHKDSLKLLKELRAKNQAATRPVIQRSMKMLSGDDRLGREAGDDDNINEQNNSTIGEAIFTPISSRLPSPILEDDNVPRSDDLLKLSSTQSNRINAAKRFTATSTSQASDPKSGEDDEHSRSKSSHSKTHSINSSGSKMPKTASETSEEEHSSYKSSIKSASSTSGKSSSTTRSSLLSLDSRSKRSKSQQKFVSSSDDSSSATSSVPSEIIIQGSSGDSSERDGSSSSTLTRPSNTDKNRHERPSSPTSAYLKRLREQVLSDRRGSQENRK